ncbi:SRPBCC family protein [Ovoidimarina sediminis]|uniref:SRPBCC family protein n=1 Tax=Ovoidimarina sediminis TaxID=3079856 RepID=UPI002911855D|nr:SRPBCC domain-containing protein [Rhodophyticola sp. MJ-SS7]MDU8945335.1 SRPBCC domain-containing protein [Rhodophyticola sp. MJ-SS7]
MTTDLSLKVTQQIAAPPERVFDAWLDPRMLTKFITPDPGFAEPEVSNDPREGGRFDIIMKADRDLPHWGIYKVIDRPKRLVFTWVSEWSLEDSVVTLTFAPKDGGTEVTLVHERFKNEEIRDNHERGWGSILARLKAEMS